MNIGDLHTTSFSDMWRSEKRKQVMEYLNPGEHCSFHCLRHESNLEVIKLAEAGEQGEKKEPVAEFDRFI